MTDATRHPERSTPTGRRRRPERFEPLTRLRGRLVRDGADVGTLGADVPTGGGADVDEVRQALPRAARDPWPAPEPGVRPRPGAGVAGAVHQPPRWADALPAWSGPSRGAPPLRADPDEAWSTVETEPAWGARRAPVPPVPDLVRPPGVGHVAARALPTPRLAGDVAAGGDRNPTGPWARLELSDGRTLTLTRTALIGRDPAPRVGESPGTLVAVPDPGRSVSKTHLGVGVDAAGAWVVDRQSTNGTVVTLPDGQLILCVPERRVRLAPGATVSFGDHRFTVATVRTDATSHEQETTR